ncbi:MAG: ABC transporter ATP-binding protein [Hyphomicrobiales bacterium]|nr:ATP-binding cassette domain-containing protein [Hyphomicrobiales bacterium]PCJ91901.1 MAG: ABC transporter ATP-binding protein [Hyphomicrobiales bacterium]
MSDQNSGLLLQDVCILLGGKPLVHVNADVRPGDILTIMGPSGCGKSTLLSYIGGFLDRAFDGRGAIQLNGLAIDTLPAEKRHVGILFQDPLLFPHMSVGQNLLFAVPPSQKGVAHRKQLAETALEEVGMAGMFDRDPATLSGGQKARIALMRVLLSEPKALLLDEPFSKLDADRRAQLRETVFALAKSRNLPVLLVTHDSDDAKAAGGAVISPLEGMKGS